MSSVLRSFILPTAVLLSLPTVALAQTTNITPNTSTNSGWSGSGEFGFAMAEGNSHTENVTAKLALKKETRRWKDSFYLTGLRSKGNVTIIDPSTGNTITQYSTTANRYEGGASVGYKFDPRSYIVTAGRYSHDDFAADRWQAIVSVGYGHIAFKSAKSELSFEIGPGYKSYQPAYQIVDNGSGAFIYHPPKQHELVARALINWKYSFTANTALKNTLLSEVGSKNKYYQDDLGLSIGMTKNFSIKLGYEVRYNSTAAPGIRHTDKLYTTNLVYSF